jgi:proton-translocating NADH-quinone oxidoreductase chain L
MYTAIVFLPLLGSLIAGLFGRFIGRQASEIIPTALLFVSAALSVYAFYDVAYLGNSYIIPIAPWITSGDFQVGWTLRVDTLTAVMLVVVTGVSSLVHLYSIGYMDDDPHTPRFFSYLSLFTFAMLMLVTADNLLQLFFGWEGVGLASYLLIGFWYEKPSANAAAIKAFIVNRVGDFGFALGVFGLYAVFGTLDFTRIFMAAPMVAGQTFIFAGREADILTTLCILLFIGACGKSAQIGLHTWLPDAMEGPTPVSALIHAATMVTAGVFLVCRASPLFELAPAARDVVTIVGATTAFFAASVGLFQHDIKRVIAYSTCSQLGYMFAAAGVSSYGASMFHLFTHASFKALLFLGAGSVIHALHHEQDMRNMGGLKEKLPYTWAVMLIAAIALTSRHSVHAHRLRRLLFEGCDPRSRVHGPHRTGYLCVHPWHYCRRDDVVLFLAADVPHLPRPFPGRSPRLRSRARSAALDDGPARPARERGGAVGRPLLRELRRGRSPALLAQYGRRPRARRGSDTRVGHPVAVRRIGARTRHRLLLFHPASRAGGADGREAGAALHLPLQQVVLRRGL